MKHNAQMSVYNQMVALCYLTGKITAFIVMDENIWPSLVKRPSLEKI